MEIPNKIVSDTLVVTPEGRIDSVTAEAFQAALVPLLEQAAASVAVDGSQLAYVSSAGLRVFLMAAKTVKTRGGNMVICGLPPAVEEVFVVSGFSKIIPLFPDLASALPA